MKQISNSNELIFRELVGEVAACTKCERMSESVRVLGHAVGNLAADIMFIGEAPGRLGADQTQIPFHGDTAGNNFEDLLEFAGISRSEIYVTNAVLCNPRDERGNNSTPTQIEVSNCGSYLRRQIDLVRPRIIVTLGATSLRALESIEKHGLALREHVRTANKWYGSILIPLYHPGQRAMIHRSHANQRSDYQFVADTLSHVSGKKRKVSGQTRSDVLAACRYILQCRGEISYFELHKLAYLAEYAYVKATGERLTKAYFIRQKDGPYCVDLSLQRLKRADSRIRVESRASKLFVHLDDGGSSDLFGGDGFVVEGAREILEDVLKRYRYPTDSELKTAVYLTAPMRNILRKEQAQKINMYNAPIDFFGA